MPGDPGRRDIRPGRQRPAALAEIAPGGSRRRRSSPADAIVIGRPSFAIVDDRHEAIVIDAFAEFLLDILAEEDAAPQATVGGP
jgi:hypothetical protein